jgi:hypothetical protein
VPLNPKTRQEILGNELAKFDYSQAMGAIRAFARHTNCPLGIDIVEWFKAKHDQLIAAELEETSS